MTSFECLPPSYQLAPVPRLGRVACGCCHSVHEKSNSVHETLGPLCVWCARAFDLTTNELGLPVRDRDICPFCEEGGCALHDDD